MSKLLPGLFPKGTGQDNCPQTPALPKLWNDRARFEAAARDLQIRSAKLAEVAEDATAHLSDADRAAIAAYLSSLSPIPRR